MKMDSQEDIFEADEDLHALGVTGEWIWGNCAETAVFAQAFGDGKTLIFRFSLDPSNLQSLPCRIVHYYHNHDVPVQASFASPFEMRQAIWATVAVVWDRLCDPFLTAPDVVVDIYGPKSSQVTHDALFDDYFDALQPLNNLEFGRAVEAVDWASLERIQGLGTRGSTALVARDLEPETKFVFQGLDFRTFIDIHEKCDVEERVNVFKRSTELVGSMRKHANILPAPRMLVTVRKPSTAIPVVCGALYPYYPSGTVAGRIESSNSRGTRIHLSLKARWCYQMAAAIAHTHHVARTYHMDVRPSNFIIDRNYDLILIGWNQNKATISTSAPETDGTFDATSVVIQRPDGPSSTVVRYTKYQGPSRSNMPNRYARDGMSRWSPFPIWQEKCPLATEAAEVFSLGRAMWMLLRQSCEEDHAFIDNTHEVNEDWGMADDIPALWKGAIEACLKRDPNERPRLEFVAAFWKACMEDYSYR